MGPQNAVICPYIPPHTIASFRGQQKPWGVYPINTKSVWGAMCLVWHPETLRAIINTEKAKNWVGLRRRLGKEEYNRRKDNPEFIRNLDTVLGYIIKDLGKKIYYCNPSCAQHISVDSSIGGRPAVGNRAALFLAGRDCPTPLQIPVGRGGCWWVNLWVLTEYFRAEHSGRRKEIAKSIEVNCRIPETKMVVVFMNEDQELPGSIKKALSDENFEKIKIHHTPEGHRSTYGEFFSYANENLEGELCVLCNNDMSFDESLNEITCNEEFDLEDHFISLTRWDVLHDNSLRFKRPERIRKNSQDAWDIQAPSSLEDDREGRLLYGSPRM